MTTKLIQELVGLCVEKGLEFEYKPSWGILFIDFNDHECYHHEIELNKPDAPQQMQAAIERVKQL